MKGPQDFLALSKKNNEKINKVFSGESKEQPLKRTGIITYIRGFVSSNIPHSYAKLFLVISNIHSTAFVIQGSFLKN